MSESSNDFWINNFKNIIEGNYERLVQLIKSERGFWLYDIEKKEFTFQTVLNTFLSK